MRGRVWLESQGLSVHKPFALAAAILLLFAVACIPTTPESHIRITDAHCQNEDLRQAFGIEYRHVRIVAPMILPGNSSGLRDSYGTYWSADVRFGELQSEIGCLTRIYDSADNAHRALEDLMEVRFKISGIESQPPELIEENPVDLPAIGHESLAFRIDAGRYNGDSGNISSESSRDYVATTVMFRRETVVVTITVSANCFGFNRQLCDTVPDLLADSETVDGLVGVARLLDGRILSELG